MNEKFIMKFDIITKRETESKIREPMTKKIHYTCFDDDWTGIS